MATILSPISLRERLPLLEAPPAVERGTEPVATPRRTSRHVLTIEPAAFLSREHQRAFRAANYILRPVRQWHLAVDWVEQGAPDAILLDVDAIDAAVSTLNVSARRLITLLRRGARDRAIPIAIVSRRDYVEIEDIVQSGVDVFVPTSAPMFCLIQRIDAAWSRAHLRAVGA
jgi:DNA-binding NarL/FixJ family response regulator